MAEIRPFRPLRYTDKAGRIEDLVCPPYDIISEEERQEYLRVNPHNMIRLELPKEGEDPYKEAGKTLNQWIDSGIVALDEKPSIIIYEEVFSAHGKDYTIKGFVCRLKLEALDAGVVLPHEETLSKAKQDRLNLMTTTGCNFSSVYSMYHDKEKEVFPLIEKFSDRTPDQEFVTKEDGITHRIWFVTNTDDIEAITSKFDNKQVYIADGHHRYTTALNYRDQLKAQGVVTDETHPANYVMMTLMNLENPGLVVFPTHRVIKNMDNLDAAKLLKDSEKYFDIEKVDVKSLEDEIIKRGQTGKKVMAFYNEGEGWVMELKDDEIMKELLPDMSDAYRKLDVTILHTLVLERLLGIDKENLANQTNLIYTREANDAISLVDSGQGNCAFLINYTGVEEIAAVADAGEKMPQKSTYFYPKLITGHVMNQIIEVK